MRSGLALVRLAADRRLRIWVTLSRAISVTSRRRRRGAGRRSSAAGATSSTGRPRRAATASGRSSIFSAATVACTMLIALDEPSDLLSTSWMPAHSSTARTGPPAITPVPGAAGRSRTTPAAFSPCTGCGMVPWMRGTAEEVLLGLLDTLGDRRRAPPWPCRSRRRPVPSPSPTTTSAVKLKRRPPLTTLATRLIATTRSMYAALLGRRRRRDGRRGGHGGRRRRRRRAVRCAAVRSSDVPLLSLYVCSVVPSERQARLAGAVGAGPRSRPWYLLPPRSKTTTVDAGSLGALGDELADLAAPWPSCRPRARAGRPPWSTRDASVWPTRSSTTWTHDVPGGAGDDQARTRRRCRRPSCGPRMLAARGGPHVAARCLRA